MNRQDAEKIITEYLKPIFGFALKRCRSVQDAEDLSQEIVLKAFRTLLIRDDIRDTGKFIWTIAHNMLSNYYRDASHSIIGVPIDEAAEFLADISADSDITSGTEDTADSLERLQSEIAYLSRLQRKIVIAYYFENRKQAEIAEALSIPLGTVKWHLFEAKKELKRGMDTMRKTSELKFNPIRFQSYGINGSAGTKSPGEFFRSVLTQNICYCVRNTAKTVNEIADDLGVSPVYVETEAEFLETYGFLTLKKDRYIVNFIIDEPTAELLILQDAMYKKAAALFANDLYEELTGSGILDDPAIRCGQADSNFLLWSLIPYIAAHSGEELMKEHISFEEVATIRPDGGHNIFHASVLPEHMDLPEDYVPMHNWCGPMWIQSGGSVFWQIDSEWSDRLPATERNIPDENTRVLSYYHSDKEKRLSSSEYAWLAERRYCKTVTAAEDCTRFAWQIVILDSVEIRNRLLDIGDRLKRKHYPAFEQLKTPYIEAMLSSVPLHLRKVREYELQFTFHSDGWFLLHCITALLRNGKLKLPTEEQRKALTTLIIKQD
ncbi:MAG: RNA polymerase sigma factor [Clostridia bacterium]|nr:RNA polymerase sigma factor [Clostridia bacterium]